MNQSAFHSTAFALLLTATACHKDSNSAQPAVPDAPAKKFIGSYTGIERFSHSGYGFRVDTSYPCTYEVSLVNRDTLFIKGGSVTWKTGMQVTMDSVTGSTKWPPPQSPYTLVFMPEKDSVYVQYAVQSHDPYGVSFAGKR